VRPAGIPRASATAANDVWMAKQLRGHRHRLALPVPERVGGFWKWRIPTRARDELLVEVDEGNAKTLCEQCARRTLARASTSDESAVEGYGVFHSRDGVPFGG
jgi:hypothetical protein